MKTFTPLKADDYTQPQSSDLLIQLQTLQALVRAYFLSARSTTRVYTLQALDAEAEMLVRKLRAMHQRWNTYLPFHEAIDVHFGEWRSEVSEWLKLMDKVERHLTMDYVLDLLGAPVTELGNELDKSVSVHCAQIDKCLKESTEGWEQKVYMNSDELKDEPNKSAPVHGIQTDKCLKESTVARLHELEDELESLERFFSSELSERQFLILALRLRNRDCSRASEEAQAEVHRAHNAWPSKYIKERARQMKEDLKISLLTDPRMQELRDYVDLDYPEPYRDACFGQFIFKSREELSTADVQHLVMTIEKIRLLNDYIDPSGKQRRREQQAQGRVLSDEDKQVVSTLCKLAAQVEWRGGSTVDSITNGIRKMLGVGYTLDGQALALSDQLWALLKNRRGCDAEKSLRLTWLNIVGWCVRNERLSGGSPALCKLFFPRCNHDDYKTIDKGRCRPPRPFMLIEPLLEKFLK